MALVNGEVVPAGSPQWALNKAREWLKQCGLLYRPDLEDFTSSLAALLVEVKREAQIEWAPSVRADTLAEVRRVVEDERDRWYRVSVDHASFKPAHMACESLLARLEKL